MTTERKTAYNNGLAKMAGFRAPQAALWLREVQLSK